MILRRSERISTRPAKKNTTAEAEAIGRSRGGRSTKIHAAVDALGNPLMFVLTQGQRSDFSQAELLTEPYQAEALIADKAYDSDKFVAWLNNRGTEAVIPSRRNKLKKREIDKNLYKDRNKVERFFNRIKHFRRVATRYDKTARNYLSFVYLASIRVLLL